jgi:hypothetical protein
MQLAISIYYRTDVPISQTKNEMAYAFCFIKKYWGGGGGSRAEAQVGSLFNPFGYIFYRGKHT